MRHLIEKDNSQNLPDKPRAYITFAAFDDQFKLVDDNSGSRQVQGTPDVVQTLGADNIIMKKTGFVYIYTTNESSEDVYFDNLVVTHGSGPLLEETHYYPFGLTMAGISANALRGADYVGNRKKYNGNELQSKEFADGSGLEWYDFNARTYDQQVGRFVQIDPLIEEGDQERLSPYQFSYNDPIRYNDPDGKCPACVVVVIPLIPAATEGIVAAGAAAGAGLGLKKLFDLLKNVDLGGSTSGTPFGPYMPSSRSTVYATTGSGQTNNGSNAASNSGQSGGAASNNSQAQTGSNPPSGSGSNSSQNNNQGTRRKNRIGDTGQPNTVESNGPGTTAKKYGPDGNVQKEFNKAHQGQNVPKHEQSDHVHDYKPNPYNPSGRGDRQPGRPPKKNELKKDFGL